MSQEEYMISRKSIEVRLNGMVFLLVTKFSDDKYLCCEGTAASEGAATAKAYEGKNTFSLSKKDLMVRLQDTIGDRARELIDNLD